VAELYFIMSSGNEVGHNLFFSGSDASYSNTVSLNYLAIGLSLGTPTSITIDYAVTAICPPS
jgi:hypothetical protein